MTAEPGGEEAADEAPGSDAPANDAEESADLPHYLGHRKRMRERFLTSGEHLQDYELLEIILFRSIPRRDVKKIAKALIARFGSLPEALGARIERLMEIEGVSHGVAVELKIVEMAARRFAKSPVRERRPLSSWSDVIDYCRAAMAFAEREEFRVLFLDKRNCLIADELQSVGTVDHAPVYPREVVKRALELAATAMILVHNHPSGDPTPSSADVRMTQDIIAAAKLMTLIVHDHIVVGRNGYVSMKGQKLI